MSKASAIGVDLGSQRTVIAVASRGGVEIIANEGSHRETPNVVGYGDAERFLGPAGQAKFKSNYKNTATFFSRFLGMTGDSEDLKIERQYVYSKTRVNKDNRVVFAVKYNGEDIEILPEQAYATMLVKVKQILELNKIDNKELVLSIPSYFSQLERKLVLLAGQVAGLKIVKLMSETSATVLNYGIFRKKELTEDPRLVAFIDVGHSASSVFFAQIKKNGAEIVNERCERNLGARDFDQILYKKYRQQFDSENNIDLDEYPKSKMRLFEAIEKQRKILSSNDEAPINVEFLAEEIDFGTVMKREEFESLSAPILKIFGDMINGALKESGFTAKGFHSVEIIGGATRIPGIQKIIKKVFKVEELSKTLNASESIARGASILAAAKSPLFQVAEYNVKERNPKNILCQYKIEKLVDGKIESKEFSNTLFKKNCEYPSVMTIGVQKTVIADLKLFNEDEKPVHDERLLVDISTSKVVPKEEDFKLLLKGKIDDNGIVSMKGCELEESYIEEVRVPVPKEAKKEEPKDAKKEDTKDAKKEETKSPKKSPKKDVKKDDMEEEKKEEEFTIEKKKKTRITDVKFTDKLAHVNDSKAVFEKLFEIEGLMAFKDKLIKDTLDTKNHLESLCYDSRAKVDEDWKLYSSQTEKTEIVELSHEVENWLYDEGSDVKKDEYTTRVEMMNKAIKPVKDRLESFIKLRNGLQYAHEKLNYYANAIPSEPEKFAHLTTEDQQTILQTVQIGTEYFRAAQVKLAEAELSIAPPVKFEELANKMTDIEKTLDAILKKPKPAPPKVEEPKKDEKEGEGNMDEEKNGDAPTENGKMEEENMNGTTTEPKPEMELEKND